METTEQTHTIRTYDTDEGIRVQVCDHVTGTVLKDSGPWHNDGYRRARRWAICWAQDNLPGSVEIGALGKIESGQ